MKTGDTVRIHPATDLFMMGVVTAVITKIGVKWLWLYHAQSKTKHKVSKAFARDYFLIKER